MKHIEKQIEVNVPVRTAYDQWTQFEEFPRFMEGVEYVKQLDAKTLHWKAKVGGKTEEWNAVIDKQEPDTKVSWHSTTGAENSGTVSFQSLGPDKTRVQLDMGYAPEGAVENVGASLGLVSGRVEGDLKRFKEFIEKRGTETGAWRGKIENDQVKS